MGAATIATLGAAVIAGIQGHYDAALGCIVVVAATVAFSILGENLEQRIRGIAQEFFPDNAPLPDEDLPEEEEPLLPPPPLPGPPVLHPDDEGFGAGEEELEEEGLVLPLVGEGFVAPPAA